MSTVTPIPAVLALSIALALPVIAHAQSVPNPNDTDSPKPAKRVGYVVVKGIKDGTTEGTGSYTANSTGATGLDLSLRDTPQTVTVVTDQEMKDFNLTNMDQVLKFAPGIAIRSNDSERNSYYARGFSISNFMYDGVPVSRVSGYSSGEASSDIAFYDRIEVIKGATGLTTGVGDPGATINLIRKKPSRYLQASASAAVDSMGAWRTMGDVGGPLNESGTLRGRAVMTRSLHRTGLDRYHRKTSAFYGVIEASLSERDMVTLGFDLQNHRPNASSWGGIPLIRSNGEFNEMPRSTNVGADWSRWKQNTRSAFMRYQHGFENGWVLRGELNELVHGHDATLGSASVGFPDPQTGAGVSAWMGKYKGHTTSRSGSLLLNGPLQWLGRKHQAVLGITQTNRNNIEKIASWAGYADIDPLRGVTALPEPDWNKVASSPSQVRTNESGVYGLVRWSVTDQAKLITGARWVRYDNSQGLSERGRLMPYIGGTVDLNEHFTLYASRTGIFKPQSQVDRDDRMLAPLTGNNTELGLKSAFLRNRLHASLAFFRLQQENFALPDGMSALGKSAYRAVPGVRSRGYELEVSGQLTPGWQMQAGYTRSESLQNGLRIAAHLPLHQFSLYTGYRFVHSLPSLRLGIGTRWQSETRQSVQTGPTVGSAPSARRDFIMPSYGLTDIMGSYEFTPKLSVAANIENVTDRQYLTVHPWSKSATYLWGQGRTYSLSLNYQF